MGRAKKIIVKPIACKDARRIIKSLHYSGSVVPNSQVHFGVFLDGRCGGALQFGPSLKKRNVIGLVKNTGWYEFIELNRMALADWLPRNCESRAIAVSMRLLRETYPWLKWVLSFADATQCGDGTIYRASGFNLIGIKKNTELRIDPETGKPSQSMSEYNRCNTSNFLTWEKMKGYQLRYIYFLDPTARDRLTVPIIPFAEIQKRGAGMYKGKTRAASIETDAPGVQPGEGGETPTVALQNEGPNEISH